MPDPTVPPRGLLAPLWGYLSRKIAPVQQDPPSRRRRGAESKQFLGGTGIQFTGPSMVNNRLTWIPDGSDARPDADRLTRQIAFATAAYCYTAMHWRAKTLAEAPLMVVRETADGEKWLQGHPLERLLDRPRPDMDMGELVKRTSMYWDLGGQALWTVDRDRGGNFGMITPWSDGEFRSSRAGALIYGKYEVCIDGLWKPVGDVRNQALVHFRDVGPSSWRNPVSRVDAALIQLDLGHQVARIVRSFLDRAFFTSGVLSPDPEWDPDPEEWDEWKDAVEEWYGGARGAGPPLMVPGGTTFSRTSSAMTDMLPEALLDRVESVVASVFEVPPVVLGWLVGLQNSPWSQMGEARTQATEDTAVPRWKDGERWIGRALLAPEEIDSGIAIRFDTSRVKSLQDDRERNSRISALNADIWTVNQRLLFTGQDPLPSNDPRGDIIVGLQAPATPPASVGAGAGDGAPAKSKDALDVIWMIFDAEAKAAEGTWERVVYTQLQAQRAAVVASAREHLAGAGKSADTKAAGDSFGGDLERVMGEARAEMIATTHPLLISTGGKAVRRLSARVGLSFSVLEPGMRKYAAEESDRLAHWMGETTGRAVADAVQEGLLAGETVAGLVKRLEDLPAFDRGRARLTARTETTRAWNGSQRRSMSDFKRETGRGVSKTWINSADERVRDEHSDGIGVGGETVGIDQKFSNGLMEPGEPNCRCTLSYAVAQGDGTTDDVQEDQ